MTQFASTLYPQTNPTNRVLLEIRNAYKGRSVNYSLELVLLPLNRWFKSPDQVDHARRVLTRLANLSG